MDVAVVSLGRQVEPGEQLVGLFSQVLLKSFVQLGTTIKELVRCSPLVARDSPAVGFPSPTHSLWRPRQKSSGGYTAIEIGNSQMRRAWEGSCGRPFLWLIVGLMPKKNPLALDDQRVGASDSLTSISSCDLICCHAREDRSGSIGGSTVRFGSVVPSLKGRAGLNNQAERRERSMDHQRCSRS